MSEDQLCAIADNADFVVNGYAFTSSEQGVRVLNLKNASKAALLSAQGEMLETSMDDIELAIVKKYFERNQEFLVA